MANHDSHLTGFRENRKYRTQLQLHESVIHTGNLKPSMLTSEDSKQVNVLWPPLFNQTWWDGNCYHGPLV